MTDKGTIKTQRWNGRSALFLWGPPVALSLLIFTLSLTPGSAYPEHPGIFNVVIHFLEFAFLAFFLARALVPVQNRNTWGLLILTISLCALLGLMTELLQFTVPQRMFGVADILVDIFGAFTGTFLYINVMKTPATRRPSAGNLPETDDV